MYHWERRDKRLNSKKNRMLKHSRNIGKLYESAIIKRSRDQERKLKYQEIGEL
jgi:hypothetical protein